MTQTTSTLINLFNYNFCSEQKTTHIKLNKTKKNTSTSYMNNNPFLSHHNFLFVFNSTFNNVHFAFTFTQKFRESQIN